MGPRRGHLRSGRVGLAGSVPAGPCPGGSLRAGTVSSGTRRHGRRSSPGGVEPSRGQGLGGPGRAERRPQELARHAPRHQRRREAGSQGARRGRSRGGLRGGGGVAAGAGEGGGGRARGGSEGSGEQPAARTRGPSPLAATLCRPLALGLCSLSMTPGGRCHSVPTLQRHRLRPRERRALARGPRRQEPGFWPEQAPRPRAGALRVVGTEPGFTISNVRVTGWSPGVSGTTGGTSEAT